MYPSGGQAARREHGWRAAAVSVSRLQSGSDGRGLTPDTVHLLAQLIRHNRGVASAIEKWMKAVPEDRMVEQLGHVIAIYRGILSTVEAQLTAHVVGK